jgi:hypothetical protein
MTPTDGATRRWGQRSVRASWRDPSGVFRLERSCLFLSSGWRLVMNRVGGERATLALCLRRFLLNPSRVFDQSSQIGLRSGWLASEGIPGELESNYF